MSEEKHPGGRPLLFDDVKVLEARIAAYFADCNREEDVRVYKHGETFEWPSDKDGGGMVTRCMECRGPLADQYGLPTRGCRLVSGELKLRRPYTVTGLADWLDTSRQTLNNYEMREEFFDTIKRAKQKIENYAEERLFDKDYPIRGVIFSLSNNAENWTEKKDNTVRFPTDGAKELAKAMMSGDTPIADDDSNADGGSEESHS